MHDNKVKVTARGKMKSLGASSSCRKSFPESTAWPAGDRPVKDFAAALMPLMLSCRNFERSIDDFERRYSSSRRTRTSSISSPKSRISRLFPKAIV